MVARYITISDSIINDIDKGILLVDQRMPSLRQFTQLHDVSMTTANNCYQRLLDLGWLHAKPQIGYFITQPLNKQSTPFILHLIHKLLSLKSANPSFKG